MANLSARARTPVTLAKNVNASQTNLMKIKDIFGIGQMSMACAHISCAPFAIPLIWFANGMLNWTCTRVSHVGRQAFAVHRFASNENISSDSTITYIMNFLTDSIEFNRIPDIASVSCMHCWPRFLRSAMSEYHSEFTTILSHTHTSMLPGSRAIGSPRKKIIIIKSINYSIRLNGPAHLVFPFTNNHNDMQRRINDSKPSFSHWAWP